MHVYGMASTSVVTQFSVSQVFGGSDFGPASGVRSARALDVAGVDELARLGSSCVPAAGR